MKRFLYLILTLASTSESLPNNFPNDEELSGELERMQTVYKNRLVPFTEKVNGGEDIRRNEVIALLEGLPRFRSVNQPNGHAVHYEHIDFHYHIGTQGRNNKLRPEEVKDLYETLQPFMNVLDNHIFNYTPPKRPANLSRKEYRERFGVARPQSITEQVAVYKTFVDNPGAFNQVINEEINRLTGR